MCLRGFADGKFLQFRAEEIATVKIREAGESKLDRIDQLITTYFEANTKVWGNDASGRFAVFPWFLRLTHVFVYRILGQDMGGTRAG